MYFATTILLYSTGLQNGGKSGKSGPTSPSEGKSGKSGPTAPSEGKAGKASCISPLNDICTGKSGKSGSPSKGKSGKSGPTSPSFGKSGKSNGGDGKYLILLLVVGVCSIYCIGIYNSNLLFPIIFN